MAEQPQKPRFSSTYRPPAGGTQPGTPPARPDSGRSGPAGVPRGPASGPPGPKRPPGVSSGAPPPRDARAVSTISHTTLPPRQHIRCFECGYEFNLTGRMTSTYCPKCRTTLDLAGYTVDSECAEALKTLGTIAVTSRGSIAAAHLVATDIELHGRIRNTPAKVFGALTLFPGAEYSRKDIDSADLRLEEKAEVTFRTPAAYQHVDIAGTLRATLYATGVVTIRSTGTFIGTIVGGHLVVEDSGVLQGDMNISPEGAEEAARKREEFRENPPVGWDRERIIVPALPEPEEETPAPPSA